MSYEIIPQAPRYELNGRGVLRNRETGKILKWQVHKHGYKFTTLGAGDDKVCVSLPSLMWLLHGKIVSKKCPVPVIICKGTRSIRFDSLKQCSCWLAKFHDLNQASCRAGLSHRQKHVGGWEVHYCY